MNYIQRFLAYNEGTECHRSFLMWAAISSLAVAAGRKYVLLQGRLDVRPILYILFVSPPGFKKSYAKDVAQDLVTTAFPDHLIGADITSRDDLVRLLASQDSLRVYTDHLGNTVECHPITLYINEMKHFVSYAPSAMIGLLVDLHEKRVFRCSTIKRGLEDCIGPTLNILACENTSWMINNLKADIITGGFARRFIFVVEKYNERSIPRPYLPANAQQLWDSMVEHLRKIAGKAGKFQWGPGAEEHFDKWYKVNKENQPSDPILQDFLSTKDRHLLKTAMLLNLAEDEPTLTITPELLDESLALFEHLEVNLPTLTVAAGRNELAVPQQKILDILEQHNGIIAEKVLHKLMQRDLSFMEMEAVLRHLTATDQIVKSMVKISIVGKDTGSDKMMVMLPDRANEVKKANGRIYIKA